MWKWNEDWGLTLHSCGHMNQMSCLRFAAVVESVFFSPACQNHGCSSAAETAAAAATFGRYSGWLQTFSFSPWWEWPKDANVGRHLTPWLSRICCRPASENTRNLFWWDYSVNSYRFHIHFSDMVFRHLSTKQKNAVNLKCFKYPQIYHP